MEQIQYTQDSAHKLQNSLQSCGRSLVHSVTFISECSPLSHYITYFSFQMSYLFQLLFTEFIFSLLGLQETVQFFFLLGLNMLLKLLFFICHHFSLQQIQQQVSLSPNGLQLVSHFSSKTQNSWQPPQYSPCLCTSPSQRRLSSLSPHSPSHQGTQQSPSPVPHSLS